MIFRILISFLISIYLFSISCWAMVEIEPPQRAAPLIPILQEALERIDLNVSSKVQDRESFLGERLAYFQGVLLRDQRRYNESSQQIWCDEIFSHTAKMLVEAGELTFKKMLKRLKRQEAFSSFSTLDELKDYLYVLTNSFQVCKVKGVFFHVYFAQTVDGLAKVLTKAVLKNKTHDPTGGSKVGGIFDVHGVLAKERAPMPGEVRTVRDGIPELMELTTGTQVKVVAASAWDHFPTVLGDLRAIGLQSKFELPDDNDYRVLKIEQGDKSFVVRSHGLAVAVRYDDARDPYFREKGRTLDYAFPQYIFGTVFVADDSPGNLVRALSSLLASNMRNDVKDIYLVLVKLATDPNADGLQPKTKKMLSKALGKSKQ